MTYENILKDMLSRVTSDVDKREGSVIFDALAPCAYKLAETYFKLNNFIDLVSADTAVGEYLDRVVADYGIKRKAATYAVRKVEATAPVDIGTRWGLKDTTYVITEKMSDTEYKAKCEQLGSIGNQYSGLLDNIDNVPDVAAALTDIIISGEDEETDDSLRARFYNQIRTPSTSGNADHYRKWAMEVAGCGDAKVLPLWNGNGTVKVLVVDENMAVDEALPAAVAAHIETVRPIGAAVTVESPQEKVISISAGVVLDGSKTLNDVYNSFSKAFSEYLKDIVFKNYSISYARIGSLLLSTDGVADYVNLLVNGGAANITIGETEVPVAGTIALTEVV
ncbi:baseplate J protein [Clostridium thermosuccinogenes]|uniref:Baseplate J protein n=2 Tax=Clostridium thermosuccinogenes TaxID=84032 RepID=A0A2K2FBZ4_9CLOT|nr:baseplate J protein [Pseudoclostridium thermosuccinogenes]PNT96284.1 baseplate J protein [Pseudoclostridium thermosuccinogenes]PNT97967.1 baseplate J protein [Pseudoclostridium thermosuccinogenes]